jgi:hypothetical protein
MCPFLPNWVSDIVHTFVQARDAVERTKSYIMRTEQA